MDPPDTLQANFITEQLTWTLKAIKYNWNLFQQNELIFHNKEREKILFTNVFQQDNIELRASDINQPIFQNPNSIKTIYCDSREEWINEKILNFREMA